ncbi:dihydroxyacetone kinase subunit DhaK [Mediterraneibacter sp. NSJ-55]|uniref:Dihydroxyacetone kinase subunit DhaK n=1 Tax=Mediterraneibacter hominis TaxID=2763054 RepID=A0A923RQ26_9FIRM|nr:dihydroxyacetone kinase subunit DhaK [Mediterraneibacter hominis]MBC5689129.1 dihydroxyacetone kinase subunit DhaK [Mediterraneibacter hominis]
MKRLVNKTGTIVEDMINGYVKINRGFIKKVPGVNAVVKTCPKDKVTVIVGGGSGLDPWPVGYVGKGLADGAAVGNIFTAPPAKSILETTRILPHDKGVIYVVTNHAGDVLNFELVSELAELEGIETRQIYITDDITSASTAEKEERRGIGGVALLTKLAGAVTEAGNSLDETERILKKANHNIGTFSVTTAPSYSPVNGEKCFELEDGKMEFGMGFNGETGIKREKIGEADSIAEKLINGLSEDLNLKPYDKVVIWINGYSMTSQIELSIIAGKCCDVLKEKKIELYDILVERLFVTPGAGGLSITVMKIDEELTQYYDKSADAPFFKVGERSDSQ